MTEEKGLFSSAGFFHILSGCQRNMSKMSEGHSMKSCFSRTQKNSSPRLAEKESDQLIFHCKIEQTTKKAAIKVVNKKLHSEELIFRELITNKLWDSH